jgi:hypothetical protein
MRLEQPVNAEHGQGRDSVNVEAELDCRDEIDDKNGNTYYRYVDSDLLT